MSISEYISPLVGRLALAWFFLFEVYARAGAWEANVSLMASKQVPAPPFLFALAILVTVLGGLSLLLGFHARHGAMALFGVTVISSVLMHDYWHIVEPAARAADYAIFARNIAIAGGLLMMIGLGAGPFALDNRRKR
jgi:putative oxidoreductase